MTTDTAFLATTGPEHKRRVARPLTAGRPGTIPPRPDHDAPLSPGQQALWVADRLAPESGAYNLHHLVWLHGSVDLRALGSALDGVVARHEILRSTFTDTHPPRQVVHPPRPVSLARMDLRSLPPTQRRQAALRFAETEALRQVDLEHGPLLRALAIQTADDETLLMLATHHLVADEWSIGIMAREISALYNAHVTGGPPCPLPPPQLQYGDYAHWQAGRVAGRMTERQLDYWKRKLSGIPHILEVPTDRPRRPRPSNRGVRSRWTPEPELARRFRELAAAYGVTPFSAMVALYSVVLSRHANQERFAIGTVVSGRTRAQLEELVGLFVNLVPIPVDAAGDQTVGELLRRTGAAVLGALDHQDVSFEQVVAALNVPRSMARTPVFQALATWAEGADTSWSLTGARAQSAELGQGSAKADLMLVGSNIRDSIEFELVLEADLFARETADRLLRHFGQVLRQAVADPQRRVASLDLADDAELRSVTADWCGAVGDYESSATLGALFDRAVSRYPDAVALVSDEGSLTYRELDAAANKIAHLLRACGVRPDDRVGVSLPRSLQMVVALVGIVKAGGAYLALDPAHPPARNTLMISAGGVRVVIASRATRECIGQATEDCVQLFIDDPEVAGRLATMPGSALADVAWPDSLAQVCFTSGSTGVPKGVGIQHRGIIRMAHEPQYGRYGPDEACVLLAPISFDVSIIELWSSLLNGARLVVPPPGRLDVPDIAALLRRYGITTIVLITAMFHQMVEHDLEALSGVRQLIIGGDVALPEAVAGALRAHPELTMICCYGPTENTTISTFTAITDPSAIGARVPIGRPLPNSTGYVLDESLRPVPVGVTGELFTGGDGVARGYLGYPAATAEKFLPDPFSPVPGARMYRTGDQVRWRSDGMLDFAGRVDGQVKIRGFRIELGEIEARLSAHPAIAEAVMLARADDQGHKQLVAYLVPTAGMAAPSAAQVREFVQQMLPEYMAPAAVVVLDNMPLNDNGKVDRKALPDPQEASARGRDTHPAGPAGTATEQALAAIWAKVLGVPQVRLQDNFFDLGGDSILSIRIASAARKAGLPMSSAMIFDHQTVAELAGHLSGIITSAAPDAGAADGPVPLTPIQHWFTDNFGANNQFNQAIRLEWDNSADAGLLRDALAAVVAQHDALRLRLSQQDGTWCQQVASAEQAELLRVVDLRGLGETARTAAAAQAAATAHTSLSLADGPLLQAALLRSDAAPDQVLLVAHHLAVDTVSWDILIEDLAQAYRQLGAGRDVRLSATTTPFGIWARKITKHATSPEFAAEAESWLRYAAIAAPPFPEDYRNGQADTVAAARTVVTVLDWEATDALTSKVAQACSAKINEILLSALGRTLRDWTGSDLLRVDMEGHGRDLNVGDADLTRTMGWFTALYPVAARLPADDDPRSCLAAVRNQLSQLPGKGAGYGLARYLRPENRQGATPQRASLVFNYHGRSGLGLPDAAARFPRRLFGDVGPEIDPAAYRPYPFEVTAVIADGSLRVAWTYPSARYAEVTIRSLAYSYLEKLRDLIRSCSAPSAIPGQASSAGRAEP